MSSVSARNSFNSPSNDAKEKSASRDMFPLFPDGDDQKLNLGLSRTNSESSLFSHISSVSEHYEKINKLQEEEKQSQQTKRGALKRRAPVNTKAKEVIPSHFMDDNELSSIKKATEDESNNQTLTSASGKGKSNLKRRNSDMSSTSSSSSTASSLNTNKARLKASLDQIPSTLGTNDQEIRLTRSKLKTLIEQPLASSAVATTSSTRSTLRNTTTSTRSSNKRLEVVEEIDDAAAGSPAKMSINNLRKHNAAMMNSPNKASRSKPTRSPSPSASSVVSSCSQFSIVSVNSSVISSASAPKRRGRPPKNAKKLDDVDETPKAVDKALKTNFADNNDDIIVCSQLSPTSSVCSIASSTLRRSTRKTRLSLEHGSSEANESSDSTAPTRSLLTRSNSDRKYNLRNKASGGGGASENEETQASVESSSETRAKRITKSKSKPSSSAESHVPSSGATASNLFSIKENESAATKDSKHSSLRSSSKETK
jgi:trimeric autotransporter adhesin